MIAKSTQMTHHCCIGQTKLLTKYPWIYLQSWPASIQPPWSGCWPITFNQIHICIHVILASLNACLLDKSNMYTYSCHHSQSECMLGIWTIHIHVILASLNGCLLDKSNLYCIHIHVISASLNACYVYKLLDYSCAYSYHLGQSECMLCIWIFWTICMHICTIG